MNPGFPYISCSDCLLAILFSSWPRLRASKFANRCAAEDLRRPSGEEAEPIDDSDDRRSASCFGPSGIAGVVLSPKTLWFWEEYFCWNGEGIVDGM